MGDKKDKFSVIGIVTNADFQKCKSLIERLNVSFPKRYEKPSIVPMLDLEWNSYLIKIKRELGGKLWENRKPVVVFLNDNYIGDDVDLQQYLSSIYKFGIVRDFEEQGEQNLLEIIQKEISKQRKYVYITIAVGNIVIGTMLFLLYNDLVPQTATLFLKRMKSRTHGFICTPVHRIVKNGWIQCGGYDVNPKTIPCENYIIPHNKRGVLSMCNAGRHRQNSTQFHVSLIANPWMNYRYVAFGQLVHGDKVLSILEKLKTHYEKPLKDVRIVDTGEYLHENKFITQYLEDVEDYLEDDFDKRDDNADLRYVDSNMSVSRLKRGLYYHCDDLRSHPSMIDIPRYLKRLYGCYEEEKETASEGAEFRFINEECMQEEEEEAVCKEETCKDGICKEAFCEEKSIIEVTDHEYFGNVVLGIVDSAEKHARHQKALTFDHSTFVSSNV